MMTYIKQFNDGYAEEHRFGGNEKRCKDDWDNGYSAGIDHGKSERTAEILAIVDKMLRVNDDLSEYGLTEHERGYKNGLLLLKTRLEATDD